jgi:hypothetical protein
MKIYKSVTAFDRIILKSTSPLDQLKDQLPNGAKVKVTPVDVPFSPNWPYKVDIRQPDAATLAALKRAVGPDTQLEISYIEVARDYPVRFATEAQRLLLYFLRTATLRYGPQVVTMTENILYYGDANRGLRLALYADRPSKLATPAQGQPCLHTELRLQGAEAVRKAHLLTLDDLTSLNFKAFWNQHISLWEYGNRARMGAALRTQTPRRLITDNALRTRFSRALSGSRYTAKSIDVDTSNEGAKGPFVLQMLAAKNPEVKSTMRLLTAAEWEERARAAALKPLTWWR